MKRTLFTLIICFATGSLLHAQIGEGIPAFPGAEGFGMYTTGGRGGRVIKVTNLNDSGEGSLRTAIEESGPRIVVFEVSGTIVLESRLNIQKDDITIAGQTAPGDGITLAGQCLDVSADHIVVRYIRVRLGDQSGGDDDAIHISSGSNIIFDHVSASWSIDETFSFQSSTIDSLTVQWCMITESLRDSHHEKGNHGYGSIIGGLRQSVHHNLYAHHSSRSPKISGRRHCEVDFRNNVIYNWGYNNCYDGTKSYINWANNYYKAGPGTNSNVKNRIFQLSDQAIDSENEGWEISNTFTTSLYADGNYLVGYPNESLDNWAGGIDFADGASEAENRVLTAHNFPPITEQSAEDAYPLVLESAGAAKIRDAIDERIVNEVERGAVTFSGSLTGTPGIIDSQIDVGGLPVLTSLPAPTDTDQDGMPDDWELAHGLDPDDPADGNQDRDHDRYTNIEEYINSLALGYFDTDPLINTVKPQENQIYIARADTSIDVEVYSRDYNGGSVVRMELILDDELILENNDSAKIITTLENVSPGMHHVIVKSTDDTGNVSVENTTVFVGTKVVRIDIEESSKGRVVLDPPGGLYTEGVDVTITAIPDEGYLFHSWIKDLGTTHNKLQITTAKDLSLKPVFAKDSEKQNIWHHPVKINFQAEEDYEVTEDYIADFGGALSEKWNGYTYGWLEGNNPFNGLNLGESGVWKSFRHFESSGNTFSWGMKLPKGMYKIRLGLGGKLLLGMPTETELKINVEGMLVEDQDGVDLLDEHMLDSIPVLDGQLTLTSVEQSRICFIEIELLELVSPRTLTVENGRGDGEYFPDLGEEIMVVADTPPEGQVFDKWTGDTTCLEDVHASTTFVSMPDADVSLSATYIDVVQDTAHYLIVVNGTGGGYYISGTEVEVTAQNTQGGGSFSHWEYDCTKTVSFDGGSNPITVSMPDANVVFEAVYEMPVTGEGDIYQAEEALWDQASTAERYHRGYFGLGYVNFKENRGSFVQFSDFDGKDGGLFSIKMRYSLADREREGVIIINGTRDTMVMAGTGSWSEWGEVKVTGTLVPGTNNTIRIETSGDDLGYLDQIEVLKLNTTPVETSRTASKLKVRCYPNPFEDATTLSFELSRASDVRTQLYNLQGKQVRQLNKNACPSGINELSLHKEDLTPGLYILKVTSNHSQRCIKIILN